MLTTKQQEQLLTIKKLSTYNEISDESFLISQAIQNGIVLKLRRKIKSTKDHQRISIIEICDERLQTKVDDQLNQWKELIMSSNSKILQRDVDQTRQNIMYNVLIDALKERGNIIESY